MLNLNKKTISLFLLSIGLLSANSYARDGMYASINPMSCTPTHKTMEEQKYVTSAGRVKFKNGVTGSISFVCPLPPFRSSRADAVKLSMDYYRQSLMGQINAKIRRVHRRSGAVQDVVSVNSERRGGSRSFSTAVSNNSSSRLSFDHYTYYVQFTLTQPRIEMAIPRDDVGSQKPVQRQMAILNLFVKIIDY